MAIAAGGTTVSDSLNLDTGSYVLSAKLHVTRPPSALLPFDVICVLAQVQGQTVTPLDSATVTAAAGESRAMALAATAEVTGSVSFSVTCMASGDDATANSIRLIAIRVDAVQVVAP